MHSDNTNGKKDKMPKKVPREEAEQSPEENQPRSYRYNRDLFLSLKKDRRDSEDSSSDPHKSHKDKFKDTEEAGPKNTPKKQSDKESVFRDRYYDRDFVSSKKPSRHGSEGTPPRANIRGEVISRAEEFKGCFISSNMPVKKSDKPTFISTKCTERRQFNDPHRHSDQTTGYTKQIYTPMKYSERREGAQHDSRDYKREKMHYRSSRNMTGGEAEDGRFRRTSEGHETYKSPRTLPKKILPYQIDADLIEHYEVIEEERRQLALQREARRNRPHNREGPKPPVESQWGNKNSQLEASEWAYGQPQFNSSSKITHERSQTHADSKTYSATEYSAKNEITESCDPNEDKPSHGKDDSSDDERRNAVWKFPNDSYDIVWGSLRHN